MSNIDLKIYEDKIVKDIQRLIRINSVRDDENKTSNSIFGPGVRKALEEFCLICEENGFETFINENGYYAYAEIGPKDKEMIGIIGHVDVVPEGDHDLWTLAKPFSGDVVDNQIVGRGSIDDKGPVVLNIYSLKALIDSGYTLNKRVRIIVGGAEETTMECMHKYCELEELPVMSYSPDAEFPLIYAEKAIINGDVIGEGSSEFSITSNGAYNAVSSLAIYDGIKVEEINKYLKANNITTKIENDKLYVYGKAAHAQESHNGVNAILYLASAMYNCGIRHNLTDFLAKEITTDTKSTVLFTQTKDEESGFLTTNVGFCNINRKSSIFGIDFRTPVTYDENIFLEKLISKSKEFNLNFNKKKGAKKLYVSRESKLVTSLMDAYVSVTNDSILKPQAIGGGTYAKCFDNCVAFGAMFSDRNMKVDMHQPNELYEIKHMLPAVEIFIQAIKNLNEV